MKPFYQQALRTCTLGITFLDVIPQNLDKLVSIRSRVFVKEPQRVHEFMGDVTSVLAATP